jgi:PEP-CTERM motif-containing protein
MVFSALFSGHPCRLCILHTRLIRQGLQFALIGLVCCVLGVPQSDAALVNLGPGSFTPQATVITFSEVPLGTVNPVYNLPTASFGTVTVSFGGFFIGQAAGGGFPVTLVDHTPTVGQPLALDPAAPTTSTVNDGAPGATSPVLSGTPIFNGPISVLFSVPVAGVGLKGGFFDALHATTIEAYDSNGNVLGSITNSVTGFEFYGLADSTGGNVIKGISFFITGNEPQGFEIDDLTFGAATEIRVPEPSTWFMLGTGLSGLLAFYRRRRP